MTDKKRNGILLFAGVASIVAFFLPFLDLGGLITASGFSILVGEHVAWSLRLALLALPLGGLAMVVTALTKHRLARLTGAVFGVGVYGYLAVQMVRFFFATTGIGLWVTLAAAAVALGVALVGREK